MGRQNKCFPGEMCELGLLLKVAKPCSTSHTELRPAFMQKQSDAKCWPSRYHEYKQGIEEGCWMATLPLN